MADESEVEKVKRDSFIPLPGGITIGELRRNIPLDAQLFLRLELDAGRSIIAGQTILIAGTVYLVTPNDNYDGWVYINPVKKVLGEPEEANIQEHYDMHFSKPEVRTELKLRVLVYSPDVDLTEMISRLVASSKVNEVAEKAKKDVLDIGEPKLIEYAEKILKEINPSLNLSENFMRTVVPCLLLFIEDYIKLNEFQTVENAEGLFKEVLRDFFGKIDKIYQDKKELLESESGNNRGITVFSIDTSEESSFYGPFTFVSTYVYGRGWYICMPVGGCSQQATSALKNYFEGELPAIYTQIRESIQSDTRSGEIKIINDRSVIVARRRRRDGTFYIRLDRAVFHGDSPISDALETLNIACGQADGFNQVVIFTTEAPEISDPIVINDEDLG